MAAVLKPPRLPALAIVATAAIAAVAVAQPSERERLERLNLKETVLTAEQGRNMNQLSKLLSVQERIRRDPPPALLVSPGDARNAVRAAILVKAMTPELQKRAQTYAAEAGEIARLRRLAAVQSEALFTAESELAERPAGLRGAVSPGEKPQVMPVLPPTMLSIPTPGPMKHAFGDRLAGGLSNGLTLDAQPNAMVRSPGDGLVQYVGPVKGWGVILILRLSGGYHLVLAGLERTSVDVGQSVAAGTPVGWMPDGRQSDSELYLEVRDQGAPVDPARWLKIGAR
ncbi:murein hydrolase activator EnvC [Phenylobacterium sp.]|uniref:murein hydrolase activator EnvC family protein n=1 Tax=Phenylobacterium sp. TaxID=1871053 RepID=UPI00273360EB|nr:peptidoglycan DD-metalloendopeptidase family protein [Phenylobacterium sp.]MDP3659310.1 peptidoglycan DD-metalloendopeptidase family protein [Phenylobacterium sp.]